MRPKAPFPVPTRAPSKGVGSIASEFANTEDRNS